jgi:hypothetical protein
MLAPASDRLQVGVTEPWIATIRDPGSKPVSGCRPAFRGWMPEHGHGLPTEPRFTRETEPGRYLIEGVRLSMPGHWQLDLEIVGCGASDVARFELRL